MADMDSKSLANLMLWSLHALRVFGVVWRHASPKLRGTKSTSSVRSSLQRERLNDFNLGFSTIWEAFLNGLNPKKRNRRSRRSDFDHGVPQGAWSAWPRFPARNLRFGIVPTLSIFERLDASGGCSYLLERCLGEVGGASLKQDQFREPTALGRAAVADCSEPTSRNPGSWLYGYVNSSPCLSTTDEARRSVLQRDAPLIRVIIS